MRNHKYGFHVNAITREVQEAIMRLRPHLIKTLHHDTNFWRAAREIVPDAFFIGRLFDPNQDFRDDPQRRGREFAEKILRLEINRAEYNGKPLYDAWESYNEVMPESAPVDLQQKYDQFQVAFAEKLKVEGFEPIAMNFGTGNFLGNQFLSNFRGTLETHKYLGFHEYDWPTMDRLHNIGLRDGNGGMWLCLRYRRTMEEVRREFPDQHTVIITECGMTQGVQGGPDVGPWHPSHPIPADDYWKSLLWYNSELMKDAYVMGACLFVVGAISPWESFEHLGPIMDRLVAFQAEGASRRAEVEARATTGTGSPPARTAGVATTSVSEAGAVGTAVQPAETRPAPVETITVAIPRDLADYHSHYVLFPERTAWWWYDGAREYLRHFGSTRGEKIRDALFLRGSQGHTITCINPSKETLEQLRTLRPEAHIDVITARTPDELAAVLRDRVVRNAPFG